MDNKFSISIPNLSPDDIENLLFLAEQHARKFIYSRIHPKEIKDLEILIEYDKENELKLDCTIEIQLIKRSTVEPKKVIDEAVQKILEFIELEFNNKTQE